MAAVAEQAHGLVDDVVVPSQQLVLDAVEAFAAASVPEVPDTGSVDQDLRLWARSIVGTVTARESGAIVRALVSAGDAPQVRDLLRRYYLTRLTQVLPIVERAVQRGQLPAGTDAAEVIKHVGAPLYYRLLVIAEPVTVDAADLAAARADVFVRR